MLRGTQERRACQTTWSASTSQAPSRSSCWPARDQPAAPPVPAQHAQVCVQASMRIWDCAVLLAPPKCPAQHSLHSVTFSASKRQWPATLLAWASCN